MERRWNVRTLAWIGAVIGFVVAIFVDIDRILHPTKFQFIWDDSDLIRPVVIFSFYGATAFATLAWLRNSVFEYVRKRKR